MTSSTETAITPSTLMDAIVEQAPVALIFADCEGVIRVWNRTAEAVFGHSASEAVGASLDLIIRRINKVTVLRIPMDSDMKITIRFSFNMIYYTAYSNASFKSVQSGWMIYMIP